MSSLLQSPIIHWAGLAVRVLHVYLRNLGIMAHHIQRAVSQQRLQRENIPARTQVGDRKGVAKFVRVDMRESLRVRPNGGRGCAGCHELNGRAPALTKRGAFGSLPSSRVAK